MGEVVDLKGQQFVAPDRKIDDNQESVIHLLEELLEEAKDGKIRAFSFSYVQPDGLTQRGWSNAGNFTFLALMGAVQLLGAAMTKQRLG